MLSRGSVDPRVDEFVWAIMTGSLAAMRIDLVLFDTAFFRGAVTLEQF